MSLPAGDRRMRVVGTSVLLHALALWLAVGVRAPVHVVPMRLPGSSHGSTLSLVYLPSAGSPQLPAQKHAARLAVRQQPARLPAPAALSAPAVARAQGGGAAATDALGEGDVTVALMQYFPDPKPDLRGLPPGTQGDVVLQAVIGADGRITQLTLKQGLGHGVDEAVVATVEHWTFTPATREGKPVASEQELHFHYERS